MAWSRLIFSLLVSVSIVCAVSKGASSNVKSVQVVAEAAIASPFTPNGIKAGISAGNAYYVVKDHIGWWYDCKTNPGKPIAVPMLWGAGKADSGDAKRLADFKSKVANSTPPYFLGFEEPDCKSGSGSAGMTMDDAVDLWNNWVAPMGKRGTLLGSPSMCKQADEDWLTPFGQRTNFNWNFTNIHINKNSMAGVKKDIDYYYKKYQKPIWVSEFACVNDYWQFTPSSNQTEINIFINQIVDLFEADSRIYAYAYSNGYGLGNVWPMWKNGTLSESGRTYLNAISNTPEAHHHVEPTSNVESGGVYRSLSFYWSPTIRL
ncbi:hypothetical protein PROFUN_03393 [Planoprotostelium fungivorum]|uniref:Asl1-like glycosyl hydrolase catalytic domain-containing protein n=1 Tax=Planoprotostelium fungivorum TaxID=1890364 RepID=A0A2P6NWE3_9EUKA|nr:hypothetical protein PROFUN_03393 [Planoprotostelium fungivorum]